MKITIIKYTTLAILLLMTMGLARCSDKEDNIGGTFDVTLYGKTVPVELIPLAKIPLFVFEKVDDFSMVQIFQGEWNNSTVYITYPVPLSSISSDQQYGVIHDIKGNIISIEQFGQFDKYPPINSIKCIYIRNGNVMTLDGGSDHDGPVYVLTKKL